MQGRCTCGDIVYRLTETPLITHACHCSWCQRESGSAFALNAMIETRHIALVQGTAEAIELPSASGKGQRAMRCPRCGVTLWAHYHGTGLRFAYIKVGTLDEPGAAPPDVQIYVTTKQPWVVLPDGARVFEEFYRRSQVWRPEALARFAAERAREA